MQKSRNLFVLLRFTTVPMIPFIRFFFNFQSNLFLQGSCKLGKGPIINSLQRLSARLQLDFRCHSQATKEMPELQKYKCQARFHVSTLKYFAQLNICSPTVLTVCYSFQNVQLVRSIQSLYTIDFAEDPPMKNRNVYYF